MFDEEVIRTEEVRELIRDYRTSYDGHSKVKLRKRLDALSDKRRYGEAFIDGDNGAERDNAISSLTPFGSESFKIYMYGD